MIFIKINDVYNIILNGNVGITSGYIDVSIKICW